MRKFGNVSILLIGAIALAGLMQNCGKLQPYEYDLGNGGGSSALPPVGFFKKVNAEILTPKCLSCHSATLASGGVDYSSYAQIMATGSVIAGSPGNSSMLSTSIDGSMPQGGTHVTTSEQALISSWISRGAIQNEPPQAVAGPDQSVVFVSPSVSVNLSASGSDLDGFVSSYQWTEVSGPGTASFSAPTAAQSTASGLVLGTYVFRVTETDDGGATGSADVHVTVANGVSLATLNANIFTPKCLSCHGNAVASGNYNMATYAGIKADVVAGNAAASKLYTRCADGSMPPGNPLTAAEQGLIRDWITQGASDN